MTIAHNSRGLLAAFGLAFSLALAMPAVAQETTEQPAAEAPAPSFSEDKLQSFAVAFLEIDKLRREYTPRMEQAQSEEEKQQIQTEAGQKMLQAVEDTENISTDEYNAIIQSAQADPDFAQRLNGVIGEAAQQQQ